MVRATRPWTSSFSIAPGDHARSYVLTAEQFVPLELSQVFEFFSSASNLERITPPWLNFKIITQLPVEMKQGTLIDYWVRLHGIPLRWRTLISVWEPPFRFVDEQLKGPFSQWIHEHRFEEVDGGVMMRDRVQYRVPISSLVNRFFVQRDVERIFNYRQGTLSSIFQAEMINNDSKSSRD